MTSSRMSRSSRQNLYIPWLKTICTARFKLQIQASPLFHYSIILLITRIQYWTTFWGQYGPKMRAQDNQGFQGRNYKSAESAELLWNILHREYSGLEYEIHQV